MAYKTFVNGTVLTDTDLNTYLMKQTVIVCTSTTRPASPPEGMVIFETDSNQMRCWDTTQWWLVHTNGYPTGWVNIALGSGYTAHPTIGDTPQVRLERPGRAQMRGVVQKSTPPFVSGTSFGSITAGFRPAKQQVNICAASLDAPVGWSTRVDIMPDGTVVPQFTAVGSNTYNLLWISLNGIEYELS